MKNQDDENLISDLLKGDESAALGVYAKYKNNIANMLCFYLKNKADIDDIVSETFFVFLDQVKKSKWNIGNIESLLKGIAKRKLSDHLRKTYKLTNNFQNISIDDLTAKNQARYNVFTVSDITQNLQDKESVSKVWVLIGKLSPKYQELAIMYFVEQLELSEICQKLNRENDLVRVQIHRIRKYLKENLE